MADSDCIPSTPYTKYPCQIDGSGELPIVVDNITPVKAEIVNRLRDATIAIEAELGQMPAGTYSTVRARLDALDLLIQSIIAGSGGFEAGGDLSGTSTSQTVIGLQGRAVSNATPVDDYVLAWSASTGKWTPSPRTGISVSLSIGTSLVEVGQTVTTPSFTASYNFVPTAASLTDSDGTPSKDITSTPNSFSSDGVFTKNTFAASVVFTDTASFSASTNSGTATLAWGQKNYWDVALPGQSGSAFILAMANSQLSLSRNATVVITASSSRKVYYATRTAYGTPVFTDLDTAFPFAITFVGDYSVTNLHGFVEDYQLWESDNVGLGAVNMGVS